MAYLEEFLQTQLMNYLQKEGKAHKRVPKQADYVRFLSKEISKKLGKPIQIPTTTFSQWATGNRPPKPEHKRWLAAYFGPVIYEELGEPPEMPINPTTRKIMELTVQLDMDAQRTARDFIVALSKGKITVESALDWLATRESSQASEEPDQAKATPSDC